MKRAKKITAIGLVLVLCMGLLAGCKSKGASENEVSDVDADATYTYNVAALSTPTTWNNHDATVVEYITDYTEIPMWSLILNDTADGYEWSCEMAAEEPEDVTADYAGLEPWGVPDDATEGYAWRVTLNPDATWEDGTAINADSYIYSMQQMLNPEMNNYNASGYYTSLPIANAENYYKSDEGADMAPVVDAATWEYADYGDSGLYISFTQPAAAFYYDPDEYSAADYYSGSEDYFLNEAGEDLYEKYGGEDYVPVTDEVIADVNYFLKNWYGLDEIDENSYLDMAFYEKEIEAASWEDVGFLKTGDYELTVILSSPLSAYYFKYNSGAFALVNEELYESGKKQTGDMIKTDYGTSVDTYMSYGPYKLTNFQADKEWRLTRNENWYGWTDGRHEGQYQTTDVVFSIVPEVATQEQLFLQGKLDRFLLTADTLKNYQGSDYIAYSGAPYLWYVNINNEEELLKEREEAGVNKTILTYPDFRKGISLAINRSDFTAQLGYGKAMYGFISDYFVYDVNTGERYRDSEPAVETMKTFYGVEDTDEITGYDLDAAKQYLTAGYEQALADGTVSETDKFVFDYPVDNTGSSATREVNFFQNALDAATEGTALEGRITINMVYSEEFYDLLDSGEYDICINGWNGDAFDPYYMMYYFATDGASDQCYFGFDGKKETLDIELDGTVVTKTYYDWFEELYYGEYAIADASVRNQILAAMELGFMQMYRDCPLYSTTSAELYGMKITFPTFEEVLGVGFGGVRFMSYNYTDAEWEAFCEENNYQLNYN